MSPTLTALLLVQAKPAPKPMVPPAPALGVSYQLTAAKAIAAYELADWRKGHPKADLSISFNDPAVTPTLANLVRTRLGYKNPIPVLDATVLTLVYDAVTSPAKGRLAMDAYVFLGSFPKGFRAHYVIATDGKEPKVLLRTILTRYELPPKA